MIIAAITIIFIVVKYQYTIVPDVYDLNGESAKIKSTDASLEYNKRDFYEDDEKIVVSMFLDARTVVKNNLPFV